MLFGDELSAIYGRLPTLVAAYALIATTVIIINWDSIRSSVHTSAILQSHFTGTLASGWALVGVAVTLRLILVEYLLPGYPFTFEEIQMGRESFLVTQGSDLPVAYRFSVLMGSGGFALGDNTLESLRLVYKLAGCLSIVVMALTLRRLSVGWPATLLAVFTMSTLGLFVIGGGVAYENFSAFLFEALLLYCIVGAITSRSNAMVWAAFAGICGGILLHEWVSYQPLVLLPPLFFLARSVLTDDSECRRLSLRLCGVYIGLTILTGAPALLDLLNNPTATLLLDPLRRHAVERHPVSPDIITYLQNSGTLVWNYAASLFGHNVEVISIQFRPEGGGAIHIVPGTLFALSALYALTGRVGLLARAVALVLIVMLAGAGFLANNFLLERVASALPLLTLLAGICADSVIRRFRSDGAVTRPLRKNPLVYSTLLTGMIVAVNVTGLADITSDEAALREYQNTHYVVCLTIAEERREFGFEHIRLYSDAVCNKGDDLWLYPDMQADIRHVHVIPDDTDLLPSTLVIVGRVQGMDDTTTAATTAFAWRLQSAHTLRSKDNLLGDVAVMSFCYRCDKGDGDR